MQVAETTTQTTRPLRICSVCGKEGYVYATRKKNHSYTYTIHYNEGQIGWRRVGGRVLRKYRECRAGRLYDSIEEAVVAENRKELREKKQIQTQKLAKSIKAKITPRLQLQKQDNRHIIKTKTKFQPKRPGRMMNCPQCHHRGVLNIANRKKGTFLIRHSWDEGGRHYLNKGAETELAQRCYNR